MGIRLFLKISVMLFALVGIVYAMRYLTSQEFAEKSQSPDSALAILTGANVKASNWCPDEIEFLQLFSSDPDKSTTKDVSSAQDRAQLCEVMMGPVSKEDLEESFRPVIQALAKNGQATTLERNAKGVFRISGMPFRSDSLEKALKRYDF